jgi:hypothetical protein
MIDLINLSPCQIDRRKIPVTAFPRPRPKLPKNKLHVF